MAVQMHRASARERDNRRESFCEATACRCGHVDQVSRSATNVKLASAVRPLPFACATTKLELKGPVHVYTMHP